MKSKMNGCWTWGYKILPLMLLALLLVVSSCDNEPGEEDVLKVTTDEPTDITDTQAKLGGVVVSDGGVAVTERGVVVSLDVNPTIDDPINSAALPLGSGMGAFSETYDGFPAGTTVHVRAYATNSKGTVYGEDRSFTTTISASTLVVTTNTPTNVTSSQATLGGNITNDGGSAITARGVVISLDINPTIDDPANDDVLLMGAGTGAFSDTFEPFPPATTVHVRAFATNSHGTSYGEDKVFTTLSGCPVVVAANITAPTTWVAGKVYMVSGILSVTSTLTIEPGAVVKINAGSIYVQSGGKIIANGTAANRIVFTSFADDSYCGDSNGDGAATTAQKGDWQLVYLNGGTNSFKYCDFLYAGKNSSGRNCAVEVSIAGPNFEFDHCEFAHTLSSSSSTAYVFFAQSYMKDPAISKFTNNAFYDNDRPIYLDLNYTMNPNNIFHDPKNASVKNTRNAIFYNGGSIEGHTVNWNVSEVPYVVGYCRAHVGSTLNIGPNVIVKFLATDGELLSTNTINVNASAFITSYKDDAHGGDSNGDGNASAPANGDWWGYSNNITGYWVYVHGANILYAGH